MGSYRAVFRIFVRGRGLHKNFIRGINNLFKSNFALFLRVRETFGEGVKPLIPWIRPWVITMYEIALATILLLTGHCKAYHTNDFAHNIYMHIAESIANISFGWLRSISKIFT